MYKVRENVQTDITCPLKYFFRVRPLVDTVKVSVGIERGEKGFRIDFLPTISFLLFLLYPHTTQQTPSQLLLVLFPSSEDSLFFLRNLEHYNDSSTRVLFIKEWEANTFFSS